MTWSETRRKLIRLATRRLDRRIIGKPHRFAAGPDGVASSLGSQNGHTKLPLNWPDDADQAGRIRLSERPDRTGRAVRARSICIASGKGGTGKTCVTAALARLFSSRGRTLIVDGDLGVGNAHILQDVTPPKTIVDVVEDGVSVRDALVHCSGQVDLLAAGSGVPRMAELSPSEVNLLASGLEEVELDYKFVVVDSAAGLSRQTMSFARACDITLIVTTPDLTAMTDAYAFLKVLLERTRTTPLLLVNRARSEDEGYEATQRILGVCQRFLGCAPRSIGWLPEDPMVGECANRRGSVVSLKPHAIAAIALQDKAVQILGAMNSIHAEGVGRRLLGYVDHADRRRDERA